MVGLMVSNQGISAIVYALPGGLLVAATVFVLGGIIDSKHHSYTPWKTSSIPWYSRIGLLIQKILHL